MKALCVFTGSNRGTREAYATAARALGQVLARRGIALVYGGGRVGLMGVLADEVLAGGGHVTGVIPESLMAKEVGHRGLTDLRVVKSMHERKALMADLADGFVALPGGFGTLDELFEALTWAQLGYHAKPCGFLNVDGYFDHLLAFVGHSVGEGFVKQAHADMITVADSPETLLFGFAAYQAPIVEKWKEKGP